MRNYGWWSVLKCLWRSFSTQKQFWNEQLLPFSVHKSSNTQYKIFYESTGSLVNLMVLLVTQLFAEWWEKNIAKNIKMCMAERMDSGFPFASLRSRLSTQFWHRGLLRTGLIPHAYLCMSESEWMSEISQHRGCSSLAARASGRSEREEVGLSNPRATGCLMKKTQLG